MLEATKDDEVVEVPVDDGGLHALQAFGADTVADGFQSVFARCHQQAAGR